MAFSACSGWVLWEPEPETRWQTTTREEREEAVSDNYQQALGAINVIAADLAAAKHDDAFEEMLNASTTAVMFASVQAALAQVDAIRELTEAVKGLQR